MFNYREWAREKSNFSFTICMNKMSFTTDAMKNTRKIVHIFNWPSQRAPIRWNKIKEKKFKWWHCESIGIRLDNDSTNNVFAAVACRKFKKRKIYSASIASLPNRTYVRSFVWNVFTLGGNIDVPNEFCSLLLQENFHRRIFAALSFRDVKIEQMFTKFHRININQSFTSLIEFEWENDEIKSMKPFSGKAYLGMLYDLSLPYNKSY